MRQPLLPLIFCCIAFLGSWLISTIWNETVYVYVGEDRSPAAIKNLADYYPVDGRLIREPMDEQLFKRINFISRDSELGVRLGHFLVRDSAGRRRFACQARSLPGLYDRMELRFVGVGVSDNGDVPKMIVDTACASEDDLSYLSTVWIPMADIYQTDPILQEKQEPEFGSTMIHFEHLASSWPERWTLIDVRLYRSDMRSSLTLEPSRDIQRDTLTFNWDRR